MLVATHRDERDADLPLSELQNKYPQIVGHCEISSKTGYGIEMLRSMITDATASLPLMGEHWPASWLNAANAVRSMPEKYVPPHRLWHLMTQHQVQASSQVVLARWLHELGEILFFHNNEELNDIVILQPQWVSQYISKVLESEEVIRRSGVFTREHMIELWQDLDPAMQDHFLRLMERFDLSYRTLERRDISLVVERLPLDQPDYEPMWDAYKANGSYHEIGMKFDLNTIPAGIPTWFIARVHRFTTRTHWRNGAVFAYEPDERKHLALVQSFPHQSYLRLTVRGPTPANFFALLKDGVDLTLARFPGLQVNRLIPCPGHDGEPCSHEFSYEQLLKRVEKKPMIECPESLEDVSVHGLLFGLDWSTKDAVLIRINELQAASEEQHEEVLGELKNLRELSQREFVSAFRREQAKIESHCPNIFALRPRSVEE
ncbi:MAG: COR domain-containing protein [Rubrobacteraceae bacterium]